MMILVRSSQQTIMALDALNADLRRIRSALEGLTRDEAMELAETRAAALVDKARALRMSIRGDRAAAKAADRANEARNRTMPDLVEPEKATV